MQDRFLNYTNNFELFCSFSLGKRHTKTHSAVYMIICYSVVCAM